MWLKLMDEHGIEYAVLFPTGSGNFAKLREVEFAKALCRAANTMFARDYSDPSPRIKAVGVLTLQDPAAAAAELRHAVAELGLISFELLSMGLPYGLGDPIYDPIWTAANELGVPLCIHGNRQSSAEVGGDRFRTFGEMHCYTFPAGIMLHFTSILWNAIPLRFPNVKLAFLEVGATWLPYYLDRLDEHWELRGAVEAPHLPMKPSQLFRQSPIYVSLEAEEGLLPETVAYVGDDHFIYASDIPHWDMGFPANLRDLRAHPRLSRETKEKILYRNTQALFGLGTRVGAPA
jgi:predicted TIM-barrel fold metal-dependent hydrolase